MDCNSCGKVRLYQGMFIPRQSYYGDYVYPGGRVVVSAGNGMTFSTRVPVVRCVWVPVVMSCRVRHLMSLLPENPAPLMLIRC
jgi:hypothetical protein